MLMLDGAGSQMLDVDVDDEANEMKEEEVIYYIPALLPSVHLPYTRRERSVIPASVQGKCRDDERSSEKEHRIVKSKPSIFVGVLRIIPA